jgi:HlyD family secretion protein
LIPLEMSAASARARARALRAVSTSACRTALREVLDSNIHQAEAQLKLAEDREQATRLLAPSDGTVLKLLKREGEGVHPSDPEAVLLFGDLSRLHVRADIDERFVQLLRAGQPDKRAPIA